MNPAPVFKAYPLSPEPRFGGWFAWGILLITLAGSAGALLQPWLERRHLAVAAALIAVTWLFALLLRVLYYRFNRHNAQCYDAAAEQVQQVWWARHRQHAALVEAVLLGPACSVPQHRTRLFDSSFACPAPEDAGSGPVIRIRQVMGLDATARERELARLLVMQWWRQAPESRDMHISQTYWQGSADAWQAFVQQMHVTFPALGLPTQPQPWQGIETLSTLIDHLQTAPPDTRILCAGCECSPPQPGATLPAGEAAVLWLLAPQGGVRLCRGEWFSADREPLTAVAERALQQAHLSAPPATCVSFSQPDPQPDLPWNLRQHLQDAHFGTLPALGAMVAQTLAAWQTQQQGEPCAWLANDPQYTLALGVVKPHDSSN